MIRNKRTPLNPPVNGGKRNNTLAIALGVILMLLVGVGLAQFQPDGGDRQKEYMIDLRTHGSAMEADSGDIDSAESIIIHPIDWEWPMNAWTLESYFDTTTAMMDTVYVQERHITYRGGTYSDWADVDTLIAAGTRSYKDVKPSTKKYDSQQFRGVGHAHGADSETTEDATLHLIMHYR